MSSVPHSELISNPDSNSNSDNNDIIKQLQLELHNLNILYNKEKLLRIEERKGRIACEIKLNNITSMSSKSLISSSESNNIDNNGISNEISNDIDMNKDRDINSHIFKTIGIMSTIFPDKRGVPRQGILASNSKSVLKFYNYIQSSSYDDLELFSHVWILFVFHKNTNMSKININNNSDNNKNKFNNFKWKIAPPRLNGKKTVYF